MKIRKGFVSNSSSSSFVCDICGANESGWDMGLEDAGMSSCANGGHTFCDSHMTNKEEWSFESLSLDERRKLCVDGAYGDEKKEELQKTDEEGLNDFYLDNIEPEERYEIPSSGCPCCLLSELPDYDILEYLLFSNKCTREDVLNKIRDKYANYEEMLKDIKGK